MRRELDFFLLLLVLTRPVANGSPSCKYSVGALEWQEFGGNVGELHHVRSEGSSTGGV